MSVWSDLRKRSSGEVTRREDYFKGATLEKIEEMLKSMRVGQNPGEYNPIHSFTVTVERFDESYIVYSITAVAIQQQDGTRNFYSENVVDSFRTLIEGIGYIIKIDDNLFV